MEKRADLLRFFSMRLKSNEAAEDLVQDIFLKISDLDDGHVSNPTAFLYRIGWNIMLDQLRGQRRSRARNQDWSDANHKKIAHEAVVDTTPADDALSARQKLRQIIESLDRLPAQTQRVFRLHKFEGLSHAEVAMKLGISRSAVEKHVSAALRHLTGLRR